MLVMCMCDTETDHKFAMWLVLHDLSLGLAPFCFACFVFLGVQRTKLLAEETPIQPSADFRFGDLLLALPSRFRHRLANQRNGQAADRYTDRQRKKGRQVDKWKHFYR